jgi:hypothetical protein
VDGLEPRTDVIVDFGIGSLRLRALPVESVRRDPLSSESLLRGIVDLRGHHVPHHLRERGVDFARRFRSGVREDGPTHAFCRACHHGGRSGQTAVAPPVSGSVAAHHQMREVVKSFDD